MKELSRVVAGLLTVGACVGAQSAKLPLYDDFSTTGIDRSRWFETETWRLVENGKAKLGRWIYGSTASNAGTTTESFNLTLAGVAMPKGLGATIKVTDLSINEGCAANSSPSLPRARIIASYFNIRPGGPVPGDRTGDVLALIHLIRASNSSDPPDVLRVQGRVAECTNADCSGTALLYAVELGTAAKGDPVLAQVDWDKKNNKFRFTRDKTTIQETPYTEDDSFEPSLGFANLSLRNEAANCTATKVKSGLSAEFDDVRLNP
ncbi:hypothetical protein [Ideonella sp. YS5]|uniref:hypothetical protein n=1 Tax=Ideonella sp. YS5 TaxID=3453714 RepID=UPI003EEC4722